MASSVVVMGVAGCGKSSLGRAVATALDWRFIEGDEHHSALSRRKMAQGVALTDADRAGWLEQLGRELQAPTGPAVLTCSALKERYRHTLRTASPGLRFVFLDIDREQALARVTARQGSHFFSPRLVDTQFATLEPPRSEARVLWLHAAQPLDVLCRQTLQWLEESE